MFNTNARMGYDAPYTMIPNAFIDLYMSAENPIFTLVYIDLYRHCAASSKDTGVKRVADRLQILESDVIKALKYWQRKGLIELSEGGDLNVVFLEIKPEASSPVDAVLETDSEMSPAVKPAITKPAYSREELEMYRNESKEIRDLFLMAERELGKLLSFNDMNALFSMYDWLKLPAQVIERLVTYCSETGRANMRYIERVAVDWAENGVYTVDSANSYIDAFNNDYHAIMKAFGHSRRSPTPVETRLMKKWIGEMRMPLDVILEACDRTIMQIGQPKFSYADKILERWNESGIKTPQDVIAEEEKFYAAREKSAEAAKAQKRVRSTRVNRFANFKQREWNYDQIEKLEQRMLSDGVALEK
ncbi:MAG: DnaD domain protein [Clostridiales bacterium]|jgi:DnaD/phage-associated family protein|nr:DnaD domain protein [Clostridiales bacterium]